MAIFHLSIKPISRSAGRSATAAAAYRAGEKIEDERTGEVHDYLRKAGVASADLVLPEGAPEWASNRSKLWNAAEQAEKRKDACGRRPCMIWSSVPPRSLQLNGSARRFRSNASRHRPAKRRHSAKQPTGGRFTPCGPSCTTWAWLCVF